MVYITDIGAYFIVYSPVLFGLMILSTVLYAYSSGKNPNSGVTKTFKWIALISAIALGLLFVLMVSGGIFSR